MLVQNVAGVGAVSIDGVGTHGKLSVFTRKERKEVNEVGDSSCLNSFHGDVHGDNYYECQNRYWKFEVTKNKIR